MTTMHEKISFTSSSFGISPNLSVSSFRSLVAFPVIKQWYWIFLLGFLALPLSSAEAISILTVINTYPNVNHNFLCRTNNDGATYEKWAHLTPTCLFGLGYACCVHGKRSHQDDRAHCVWRWDTTLISCDS